MVSYVTNPLTGRKIKRGGSTASIPAVAFRLRTKRTFQGTKRTGTGSFPLAVGSMRQVWNGTAHHTSGGETRSAIGQKRDGSLYFKSRRAAALRNPSFMAASRMFRAPRFV